MRAPYLERVIQDDLLDTGEADLLAITRQLRPRGMKPFQYKKLAKRYTVCINSLLTPAWQTFVFCHELAHVMQHQSALRFDCQGRVKGRAHSLNRFPENEWRAERAACEFALPLAWAREADTGACELAKQLKLPVSVVACQFARVGKLPPLLIAEGLLVCARCGDSTAGVREGCECVTRREKKSFSSLTNLTPHIKEQDLCR